MPETLLYFVDDDDLACHLFQRHCRQLGYHCRVFNQATDCLETIEAQIPSMLLADLNMPGMDGFELISRVRIMYPQLPVLALTGQSTVERAVQAMQAGASDFLKKPYEQDELCLTIERCLNHAQALSENHELKRQVLEPETGFGMLGNAPSMRQVYSMIDKLAEVDCPVIILGQSGSGKELVARAIHDRGARRQEPFVVIDCGCLSDTLLESELFGHKRGAFTGADKERVGLLETARGGTVFLDEIGNISETMQTKLLRVLQEHTLTPVGSSRVVQVQARFICATHRDLPQMVSNDEFRHDLYHRLNVVTIHTPTLAERKEDIPLLVQHFADKFCTKYQRPPLHFSATAMRQLCQRPWPGNVRELRNYVERCTIMADQKVIDADPALPQSSLEQGNVTALPDDESNLQTLRELEARHIQRVLESVGDNHRQAADILGISRTTLWRKLREAEK
ncbi:sigma-54-dependent transcriptional regulator [Candidatus Venteria ishoeyi]|uniref:Transcriptional regulatory protein ZraR n=1 Tax=Candidatus Venteria ishoeyi TaxID=1899563 RepID=A0A1H6FGJ0_9GAMM|nr:sigma-54 dependent transcriptional regulator [Candidatus Venteria ishoeyi]MDM8548115.1 sigma-54 dependent transcriptional regulator [Candidatus Venteria ishoeyi]SEH09200.1 Transcriptional regulatory protein ZraR [Candidatus Venteria ishoeyi]SEH09325.1 Transcriptional regulatory protein ZraR [Candidatus Venteria ishoeyi]